MTIRSFFRKLKIRVKTFLFITILTILEVILLFWKNDWKPTFIMLLPLVQYVLIFEKKAKWDKLSDEEKEEVLISEDNIIGLVRGVEKLVGEGETADSIMKKIKED